MAMPRIFTNFINGEWVATSNGRTYENLNPANRSELLGVFQKSTPQDVD
jgi:aldehyde dehydrogenase (NAD+)